jgi:hypothetical protein
MPSQLTREIIAAAIDGFEAQKQHIDTQIASLRGMLSGNPAKPAATAEAPRRERRKMSAASRARIAEAQRKRWELKKADAGKAQPAAKKAKRKLSSARRAALAANLAKARAAKAAKKAAAAD